MWLLGDRRLARRHYHALQGCSSSVSQLVADSEDSFTQLTRHLAWPKAPAAFDSPGSPPAPAASAPAGTDGADRIGSRAEAARAGPKPEEPGLQAATDSASSLPDAGRKERQHKARVQAAARQSFISAVGSNGGPVARQIPCSAQRSSSASPELSATQQNLSSTAQAGAPANEAVLQAAEHLLPEPAGTLPQSALGEGRKRRKGKESSTGQERF